MAKNWTEEEEEHIRQNFLTQTYGELAEHFGVTTKAMESKIRRLGLKKQELLAEAADPLDVEPVVQYEEPEEPEDEPGPSPIESIHKLERRIEVYEETEEERETRLEQTREAAETEKARREELREQKPIADALKKFEDGVTKLLDGKRAQAAKIFQAIIDDPPNDLGLVMRARQYLAATEPGESEPKLKGADDFYNHGVVLMNDGDYEGALEAFEVAADKAPEDDRISYVRAVALALSEEEEAALEMLAAAIALNDVNRVYARNDPDFAALAGNAEFRELTAPPEPEDQEAEDEAEA